MKKNLCLTLVIGFCCLALSGGLLEAQAQGNRSSVQRITGTAVGIGGRFGGRSQPFTLIVNGYTAPNQVRELNGALQQGGQDELLKVLSRMDAGRIQIGSGVGVKANAIISDSWGDGGTKLTVLYERNINFYEFRYGARSQDYRFGYAEIFIEREGKGQGTLIAAARVKLEGGNTWVVEDFGTFPARLMGLRSSGSLRPR
jgi:hypothetical protein